MRAAGGSEGGEGRGPEKTPPTLNFLAALQNGSDYATLKAKASAFSGTPGTNTPQIPDPRPYKNSYALQKHTMDAITTFASTIIPEFSVFEKEISSNSVENSPSTATPGTFFSFPPINGGGKDSKTPEEIMTDIEKITKHDNFKGGVVAVQTSKTIMFTPPARSLALPSQDGK